MLYSNEYMGQSKKCPDSLKFSHFEQSVLNETLAPDVFDYEDSKSESWYRAKISSISISVFQIVPVTFFREKRVEKSCYYQSAMFYNYKNYLKHVGGRNVFENCCRDPSSGRPSSQGAGAWAHRRCAERNNLR